MKYLAAILILSVAVAGCGRQKKSAKQDFKLAIEQMLLSQAGDTLSLISDVASAARLENNQIDGYLVEKITAAAMKRNPGIIYVSVINQDGTIIFSLYAGQRQGEKQVPSELKANSYDIEKFIVSPSGMGMGYISAGYARKAIDAKIKEIAEGK